MNQAELRQTLGITRVHHVGVLTRDIEAAVETYAGLLGNRPPRVVDVKRPGVQLRSAMIPVGAESGTHVQLIQPIEGPGVLELGTGGEGTLYEIAFEVADIAAAAAAMRASGERPTDVAGLEFDGPYLVASSGNRYFYLQPSERRGTRLELIEVQR
jgi:catechol 2,3-dioxygenase-like lactoylglutathione lyase family enzyme